MPQWLALTRFRLVKLILPIIVLFCAIWLHRKQQTHFQELTTLQENYINTFDYQYMTSNKDFCRNKPDINILCVVHSAPSHFHKRDAIRKTWGNKKLYNQTKMAVLFFLGNSSVLTESDQLSQEIEIHNDIVMENYMDTYANLSLKAMSWLLWTSRFCPQPEYVLKTDDDIFVNTQRLLQLLKETKMAKESFICQCLKWQLIERWSSSKWYVPFEEFPGVFYPRYCNGHAYTLRTGVIERLIDAWRRVPLFWVDDVYITGNLRIAIGKELLDINKHHVKNPSFDVATGKDVVFSLLEQNFSRIFDMWAHFHND